MIVLYQYNEATMRAPYEDPIWDQWRRLLSIVHLQAEAAPGYIGRYRGEDDVLGYIAPRWPDEPLTMGNLSAWTNKKALRAFTFGGAHAGLMRHRHRWFEEWKHDRPSLVMWWGEADRVDRADGVVDVVPRFDLDVAMLMQAQLQEHGPSSEVFGW